LPIVYRLYLKDNITLGAGRGNAFIMLLKERRKGDCGNAINSICSGIFGGSYTRWPSERECLWKKMIGEPCAGKPHARSDEGELELERARHYASSLLYWSPGQGRSVLSIPAAAEFGTKVFLAPLVPSAR
jgi:hypothetical protein